MAEPTDDPLQTLREQIRATQDAAERLAGEAAEAARAQRAGDVPPAGWDSQQGRDERAREVEALVGLLEALRSLVPRELQDQVTEVIRQVLLLLRAIIEWALDRLDRERGAEPEIEEIPIS